MAQYTVTYACGHTGTVQLYGKTADREYRLKYYESCDCPECEAKARQQKNAENAAAAAEMDFPALSGSAKQIAWAETIRMEMYNEWMEKVDRFKKSEKTKEDTQDIMDMLDKINYTIQHATSASEWIDNRNGDGRMMLNKYRKQMDDEKKETVPVDIVEVSVPAEQTHEGKVVITDKAGEVVARYVKDDTFREIMKSLDYRWIEGAWRLKKTIYTGRSIDRVAELGNKLLNAGFAVQITDDKARAAAVSGDYVPATNRWIAYNHDVGMLAIKVPTDELYQAARKIPGAKWHYNCVIVPASMYKSVLDFVSLYGYSLTPGATEKIQAEIDALRVTVDPQQPAASGTDIATNLQEILNSSRAVLEDLKDDD